MTGDNARMAFYSTTLGKNVPSLRFTITGGTGGSGGYAVNSGSNTLSSLDGASVITGSGTVSRLSGEDLTAITAYGRETLSGSDLRRRAASRDGITITGTGNGHNVGHEPVRRQGHGGAGLRLHRHLGILFHRHPRPVTRRKQHEDQ